MALPGPEPCALGQEGESELDPHTVVMVVWRYYINIEILDSQLC